MIGEKRSVVGKRYREEEQKRQVEDDFDQMIDPPISAVEARQYFGRGASGRFQQDRGGYKLHECHDNRNSQDAEANQAQPSGKLYDCSTYHSADYTGVVTNARWVVFVLCGNAEVL